MQACTAQRNGVLRANFLTMTCRPLPFRLAVHACVPWSHRRFAIVSRENQWCAKFEKMMRRGARVSGMSHPQNRECPKNVPACRQLSDNVPKCPWGGGAYSVVSVCGIDGYAKRESEMSQKIRKSGTFWDIGRCFMKHQPSKMFHSAHWKDRDQPTSPGRARAESDRWKNSTGEEVPMIRRLLSR